MVGFASTEMLCGASEFMVNPVQFQPVVPQLQQVEKQEWPVLPPARMRLPDRAIQEMHAKVIGDACGSTPSAREVLRRVEQFYPESPISLDNLMRRMSRLELKYDSDQRLRQLLIKKVLLSWGEIVAREGTETKLTIPTIREVIERQGFQYSEVELTRAWYALRKRDPSVRSFALESTRRPPPLTPSQHHMLARYEALKQRFAPELPTFAAFVADARRWPVVFKPGSTNRHFFRDALLGRAARLNDRLESAKQLVFRPDDSVVDLRDRKILPVVTRHLEQNAGRVFGAALLREIRSEIKEDFTQLQLRRFVWRNRSALGIGPHWNALGYSKLVTNAEIIGAYRLLESLHEKLEVKRRPTVRELQAELRSRGLRLATSSLKKRLGQISNYEVKRKRPALSTTSSGTPLIAYAIAYAHATLSADSNRPPTRREVRIEVSDLLDLDLSASQIEQYVSPFGLKHRVRDRTLRAKLSGISFGRALATGLDDASLENYAAEHSARLRAPVRPKALAAELAQHGISITWQHLDARLKALGIPRCATRTAQIRAMCKTVADAWDARYGRAPGLHEVTEYAADSPLNVTRADVLIAFRELRRLNPGVRRYSPERRNLDLVVAAAIEQSEEDRPRIDHVASSCSLSVAEVSQIVSRINRERARAGKSLMLLSGEMSHDALRTIQRYAGITAKLPLEQLWGGLQRAEEDLRGEFKVLRRLRSEMRAAGLSPFPFPADVEPSQRAIFSAQLQIHRLYRTLLVLDPVPISRQAQEAARHPESLLASRFAEKESENFLKGLALVSISLFERRLMNAEQLGTVLRLIRERAVSAEQLAAETAKILAQLPAPLRQ